MKASIDCPDCRELVKVHCAGITSVSRAAVLHLHGWHRPMHPNEVGASHRASARKAYAEWEALGPYAPDRVTLRDGNRSGVGG